MLRTLPLLISMTTILPVAPCAAQADSTARPPEAMAPGPSRYALQIDNDAMLMRKLDKFYTSGVRFEAHHAVLTGQRLADHGWRVGQDQYTNSNIALAPADIAANDRPYAGWLFAGVFTSIDWRDGRSSTVGIDFGCLGPCAGAANAQKTLHRLLDRRRPQGWSTQVRNEPGVVLYGDITPARWQLARHVDLAPTLHGRFGNIFTDAGLGLSLRTGRLSNLPWQTTLHGFVRLDGRAVAYDATLQGGFFSGGNPRTVRPKRLVGEVEAGLRWLEGQYGLSVSVVRRSNTNGELDNAGGSQTFVRLRLDYAL